MTYRVILTFEARDAAEAAAIAASPERLPREAQMRVVDVDRARAIRLAAFLGAILAFWLAVGSGLSYFWSRLP